MFTSGTCRRNVIKSGSVSVSLAINILTKSSRSIEIIVTSVRQLTVAVLLCELINVISCSVKEERRKQNTYSIYDYYYYYYFYDDYNGIKNSYAK